MLWYSHKGVSRYIDDGVVYEKRAGRFRALSGNAIFFEKFPVGTRVEYNWGGGRKTGKIKGDDGLCLLIRGGGVYGIPWKIVDAANVETI